MNDPTSHRIDLAYLAKAFDIRPAELERHLAGLGWGMLFDEAARYALAGAFGRGGGAPSAQHSAGETPVAPPVHWEHLVAAVRMLLPHVADRQAGEPRVPTECREGTLYVLHDGVTGLSKIGCTSGTGRRQRSQMAAHGSVLVNLLNAKVADMRAGEAQCHAHFSAYRRNGEWFCVPVPEILAYFASEVAWLELDRESDLRLFKYQLACWEGDMRAAKRALTGPIQAGADDAPVTFVLRRRDVAGES